MNHNDIARVAHEVNRAYCEALGDTSQAAWEDAPEWQRVSARMGVDLHCMGNFGPEASHIGWMKQKLEDGWVYGKEKNPDVKTHPCLVPFADLPKEQQAKDYIFRAVVHALRATAPVEKESIDPYWAPPAHVRAQIYRAEGFPVPETDCIEKGATNE